MGYLLEVNEETEPEEVTKFSYEATDNDGNVRTLDISPYEGYNLSLSMAVVELGFPDRNTINSIGPLTREDIRSLWNENLGHRPFPNMCDNGDI